MTLLFGTLIQDFVNFEIVVNEVKLGNAQAQAQLPLAAAHFRHAAARSASYLVYMGEPGDRFI